MQNSNSDLVVVPLDQTSFSLKDVYTLIQEVYKDRVDAGIDFTLSKISFEEYEKKIHQDNKMVFVLPKDNYLIGSAALAIRIDNGGRKYGGYSNAVVLKEYQGKGLGTKLFEARKRKAIECGCDYLSSSTAENATSSVRWHKKNGWLLYGYGKHLDSKYFSCFFRYPLKKPVTIFTRLSYRLHYLFPFVILRCLFRIEGGYTELGAFVYKMRRK
jgi:GNAT superfamily N-acetyltransferase